MSKINYKKNIIYTGLIFIISFFIFPKISQAADIEASASRTSGVAPLSVHFNADLTASSPTERSFHDLEYSWDFGDPTSGNWGTDNKPKNEDKGPIAAHVYETPGTFTATLNVRNATGVIDTKTFEITVDDPEVVFAGTKTTCISTGTDWTGCPSGANHVTSVNLDNLPSYAEAGERVLLHRGSTWAVSAAIPFVSHSGPTHIGAFGVCQGQDNLGICANAPHITMSGVDVAFLDLTDKQDWRLSDISFSASKGVSSITSGFTDIKRNLMLRLNSTGFGTPLWWTNWHYNDEDYHAENALVSSRLIDSSETVTYVGCEKLMIMGNIIQNSDTTHILRVWQGYEAVISHNILSGSSLTNTNGRHALKFHAPGEAQIGTFAQTGNGGLRVGSKFAVVSSNIFGSSGPWPLGVGPQDSGSVENLSDIIIEKNKFLASYGQISSTRVQVGMILWGRYYSVRNNVIDGTESANGYTGIYLGRRGIEWTPLGHKVFNNTIYTRESNSNGAVGIHIDAIVTDTEIRNNLVSYPNASIKVLLEDLSGITLDSHNAMTNTPYFLDPDNLSPLLRNFSLTSNSTEAIDQGTSVPVFDDFTGQSRIGTYDIGAFEYTGTDTTSPSAPHGLVVQ